MCRGGHDGEEARRCDCDSSKKRRLRSRLADVFSGWAPSATQDEVTPANIADLSLPSHVDSVATIAKTLSQYIAEGVPNDASEDAWYSGVEQRSTALGAAVAAEAERRCSISLDQEFTRSERKMIDEITELGERYSSLMSESENLENKGHTATRREQEKKRDELEKRIAEVEALSERVDAFREGKTFARYLNFEKSYRDELASNYMVVLREARSFGGTLNLGPSSMREKAALVDAVNTYYPSDWIEQAGKLTELSVNGSDDRSGFNGSEFAENGGWDSFYQIEDTDKAIIEKMSETEDGDMLEVGLPVTTQDANGTTRTYQTWRFAHRQEFDPDYDELGEGDKPLGDKWKYGYTYSSAASGHKVWYTSSTVKSESEANVSSINLNHNDDLSVAARHEVGHYFQHFAADGKILKMENSFVNRRAIAANGNLGIVSQIPDAEEGELYRNAGFLNPYSARVYQDSHGSEVFTTGMEYMFGHEMAGLVGGHQKTVLGRDVYVRADLDHRNFILGVLATI